MDRPSPAPPVWRYLTPTSLGLAALLFFLPWIDVRCESPQGRQVIFTQSGLQTIDGDLSLASILRDAQQQGRKQPGAPGEQQLVAEFRPAGAPLMGGWIACAGLGLLLAAFFPTGKARFVLVGLCCVVALALLGIQTAQEFPMMHKAAELNAKKPDPNQGPGLGPKGPNDLGQGKLVADYAAPFYLVWFFTAGALVSLLLEAQAAGKRRPARRDEDGFAPADEPEGRP